MTLNNAREADGEDAPMLHPPSQMIVAQPASSSSFSLSH
jgi:hypothetical protein